MFTTELILRIAVPSPVRDCFDYLAPPGVSKEQLQPGLRIKVPFGRRILIGILISIESRSQLPTSKLRPVINIIDDQPLFDAKFISLCQRVSEYYHYSLGEILNNALPTQLRRDIPADKPGKLAWKLMPNAFNTSAPIKKSKKQAALFNLLREHPEGITQEELKKLGYTKQAIFYLARNDIIESFRVYPQIEKSTVLDSELQLNKYQQQAVNSILENLQSYNSFLLNGVTGSGKTEVYLQVIAKILAQNKQALILVPEISLTPQTLERFKKRFNVNIVTLHSGLNPRERMETWLAAKYGNAQIIIGTRSAIFTPMNNLGIIIVDEEHDLSFKQQDSLRYSARDVAVMRAHIENIPIILGSATPSLESLFNVENGRYQALSLPLRAGKANPPAFKLIDIRKQPLEDGLSRPLLIAMRQHLAQGKQVLLFLNRRGYAPVLMCHDCGWIGKCNRCDARYTLHWKTQRLRCHHCDQDKPIPKICPECKGTQLIFLGQGTERIEQTLERNFPEYKTVRIDRDNTRRKGALDNLLNVVHENKAQILIGTQMLAKGHHFPNVTLVAIIDADSGLFSVDFRATERIGQLLTQVSGRAGRSEQPGEVIIQTHHPEHPLLQQLVNHDYQNFAKLALTERQHFGLPPYGYIALIRAESLKPNLPLEFLEYVAEITRNYSVPDIQLLGPIPASMEKRAGRFRAQLLFQAKQRKYLQQLLKSLIEQLGTSKISRGVRWSLDVDPQEMF